MIGEYEIFPFHNSDSAIKILKENLPIDKFSQRYVLWTLQEHGELSKRFKELVKIIEKYEIEIPKLLEGIKTTVALHGSGEILFEECGYNIGCLIFDFEKNTGFPSNTGKEDP